MINFINKLISKQYKKPTGLMGMIATKVMNKQNQRLYKCILNNINLEMNNTILDIGFGNGFLINEFLKTNIPLKIHGIDISNDMVKHVSIRHKNKIQNGDLTLSCQSIEKTNFEDNSFDRIFTVNTLYFWNDYPKCFTEIKRILKPNGVFLNVFYSKVFMDTLPLADYEFNKFTLDEIKEMTIQNGMKILETIEIVRGKAYCVIAKL